MEVMNWFYDEEVAFDIQGYLNSKDDMDVQMFKKEPAKKSGGSVLERPKTTRPDKKT